MRGEKVVQRTFTPAPTECGECHDLPSVEVIG